MRTASTFYRFATSLALATTLALAWLSLGVGIIGKDGDPANRVYLAVPAIGIVGAIIARFRPRGMARTSSAMAAAQACVGAVAVASGLGRPWSGALELTLLNGFFVASFAASAWLFARAAAA